MDFVLVSSCLTEFDEYYRVQDKACHGSFNELGAEARKRIVQMQSLLTRVVALETRGLEITKLLGPPTPPPDANVEEWLDGVEHKKAYRQWQNQSKTDAFNALLRELQEVGFDLELFVESFYWIAGRARSVLRLMPGLQNFGAEGVRNIRNQLLEHPEKSNSVVVWGGLGWGAPQGPVIKAVRYEYQKDVWPDKGLYVNATEFFQELSKRTKQLAENPELIKF